MIGREFYHIASKLYQKAYGTLRLKGQGPLKGTLFAFYENISDKILDSPLILVSHTGPSRGIVVVTGHSKWTWTWYIQPSREISSVLWAIKPTKILICLPPDSKFPITTSPKKDKFHPWTVVEICKNHSTVHSKLCTEYLQILLQAHPMSTLGGIVLAGPFWSYACWQYSSWLSTLLPATLMVHHLMMLFTLRHALAVLTPKKIM